MLIQAACTCARLTSTSVQYRQTIFNLSLDDHASRYVLCTVYHYAEVAYLRPLYCEVRTYVCGVRHSTTIEAFQGRVQ